MSKNKKIDKYTLMTKINDLRFEYQKLAHQLHVSYNIQKKLRVQAKMEGVKNHLSVLAKTLEMIVGKEKKGTEIPTTKPAEEVLETALASETINEKTE
jgi:hypothetical protein